MNLLLVRFMNKCKESAAAAACICSCIWVIRIKVLLPIFLFRNRLWTLNMLRSRRCACFWAVGGKSSTGLNFSHRVFHIFSVAVFGSFAAQQWVTRRKQQRSGFHKQISKPAMAACSQNNSSWHGLKNVHFPRAESHLPRSYRQKNIT